MKRVLIIEDDRDIVDLLSLHLQDMHCEVAHAYDGRSGLDLALMEPWHLIILDLMLPYLDGIDLCRQLRAEGRRIPILMLTARTEEIDKVLGLESGADDYLTKPFSLRELQARVKAIFRRVQYDQAEEEEEMGQRMVCGELVVEWDKRKVQLKGEPVHLTPKEFDLLQLLARYPGRSYSREELLRLVWGYEFSGYEHTVNSHINRLRAKIEPDMSNPTFILTTWGIGYRFSDRWG